MLFGSSHQLSPPPRVVVTGAGIISSLGTGWKVNADGFRSGRVAIGPVTLFDVTRQRVKVAGEVSLPPEFPGTRLTRSQHRRVERAGKLLLLAVIEALDQCDWDSLDAVPLVLGTTSGGMSVGQDYYRQAIRKPQSVRHQPGRAIYYQPQRQALDVVDAFGLGGPVTIIANACASGANAIGHAWECLRRREAERILTGGYEALAHLVFAGFDSLQALSPGICRPFDERRDGLALGEGAAVMALETLESAQRRGAEILGEIAGYGCSTDVHHLTQPHPEGAAALASMQAACASAGIAPNQIDYVNAHGTGTVLNDSSEAVAINRWAGERARSLPVSSTKASVGHLLGAAGAVEAVACLMALRGQWLPPTATLETPDPACALSLPRVPTDARLNYALSNSFGFGGANATLVLRRWP